MIALVHERPLRAAWATVAGLTLFAAAVRKPTLLFVTELGFISLLSQDNLFADPQTEGRTLTDRLCYEN